MISFVIPVYNSERTIKTCIKSIQSQTCKDIEIICINDGSKDNSLKILQELQNNDDRIRIINQENKGAFQARKSGILASTGDYIMFADSDDKMCNKDACKIIIDVFNNNPVQLVQFAVKKKIFFTKKISKLSVEGVITKDDVKQKYFKDFLSSESDGVITPALWNKAFKGDILRGIVKDCETSLRIGEDLLLFLNYVSSSEFLALYNLNVICYLYDSVVGYSHDLDGKVLKDYGELKKYQLTLCDNWNLCEDAVYYCNLESVYFLVVAVRNMINKQIDKNLIFNFIDESSEYECILLAKKRLSSINPNYMYDELKFLISDYTAEDYYNYCVNHMPKNSVKTKIKSVIKKYL